MRRFNSLFSILSSTQKCPVFFQAHNYALLWQGDDFLMCFWCVFIRLLFSVTSFYPCTHAALFQRLYNVHNVGTTSYGCYVIFSNVLFQKNPLPRNRFSESATPWKTPAYFPNSMEFPHWIFIFFHWRFSLWKLRYYLPYPHGIPCYLHVSLWKFLLSFHLSAIHNKEVHDLSRKSLHACTIILNSEMIPIEDSPNKDFPFFLRFLAQMQYRIDWDLILSYSCFQVTGKCECNSRVEGDKCDRCATGFYNLDEGCLRMFYFLLIGNVFRFWFSYH